MKKSLKFNVVLQAAYQIFVLIVPFITAPYIARVLGSENVGIYSYNYSIINYFMIFEMLGLEQYGNRSIAKIRDQQNEVNRVFTEIFLAHVVVSVITILAYAVFLVTFRDNTNILIGAIQSLYLIGQLFNISWLYTGLSEFRITVIRNLIIKAIMLFGIFTFVKNKDDLVLYVFILALDALISHISLWLPRRKYAKLVKVKFKAIWSHIKPMSILFVAIISSSVYRMMDKTMLGYFGRLENLGMYEYADKIINMPLSVITAIGLVMLSKTAGMFGNGQEKKAVILTKKTLNYVTLFSSMMIFGILGLGNLFCVLYLGKEYTFSGELLMLLSPTLLLCSWNNVLRTQYYIPQALDKIYLLSTIIGAIVNTFLNLILIPNYDGIGAVVATVISYFIVCVIMLLNAKRDFKIVELFFDNMKIFIIGIIPYLIILLIRNRFSNTWGSLIVQMLIFILVFGLISTPYLVKSGIVKTKKLK